jgi:phosphomevalonate kinase
VLSAPGKLVLAGEYAVLEGETALVAAVSRRLRLSSAGTAAASTALRGGSEPPAGDWRGNPQISPEIRLALEAAARRAGVTLPSFPSMPFETDNGALLHPSGAKLGLGSSAAGAVVAAAWVFDGAGRDLADPAVRDAVFAAAFEGHRAVAPRGSGADVAASTYGGVLEFVPASSPAALPTVRGVAPSSAAQISVVWTGTSVRTSELVSAVHELRERNASRYDACIDHVRRGARAMRSAWQGNDAAALVDGAREHGEALRALGEAAGAPLVDERLAHIASLAAAAGGAAKASGAGGGDVAVAVFAEKQPREAFEKCATEAGFSVVALTLGDAGVRIETDDRKKDAT